MKNSNKALWNFLCFHFSNPTYIYSYKDLDDVIISDEIGMF